MKNLSGSALAVKKGLEMSQMDILIILVGTFGRALHLEVFS